MGKLLKEQKVTLLIILFCLALFGMTFAFYQLPFQALVYPIVLSGLIFYVYGVYCTLIRKNKEKKLNRLLTLPVNLVEELSCYQGQTEEAYQKIIAALCDREAEKEEIHRNLMADMTDYYTTWVHQIKTPIASMRLHLETEDSKVARQLMDDLFRIEQYVEMVLAYLRLGSESTDYVFKEYDVDSMIRSAIRKFAGTFIAKGLYADFRPSEKTIITDEKWMSFVLEQIISNSLKYTREGGVRIAYTEENEIVIEDTGMGIEECDLPRIFERGYTGMNGREDKKASGLGLYLCRQILSRLGHSISIDSKPGCGTTVRIGIGKQNIRPE